QKFPSAATNRPLGQVRIRPATVASPAAQAVARKKSVGPRLLVATQVRVTHSCPTPFESYVRCSWLRVVSLLLWLAGKGGKDGKSEKNESDGCESAPSLFGVLGSVRLRLRLKPDRDFGERG